MYEENCDLAYRLAVQSTCRNVEKVACAGLGASAPGSKRIFAKKKEAPAESAPRLSFLSKEQASDFSEASVCLGAVSSTRSLTSPLLRIELVKYCTLSVAKCTIVYASALTTLSVLNHAQANPLVTALLSRALLKKPPLVSRICGPGKGQHKLHVTVGTAVAGLFRPARSRFLGGCIRRDGGHAMDGRKSGGRGYEWIATPKPPCCRRLRRSYHFHHRLRRQRIPPASNASRCCRVPGQAF